MSDEAAKEQQIQNAVAFLTDPKVQASSDSQKRKFLTERGMTDTDIDESFNRANKAATFAQIQNSSIAPPPASFVSRFIGPATLLVGVFFFGGRVWDLVKKGANSLLADDLESDEEEDTLRTLERDTTLLRTPQNQQLSNSLHTHPSDEAVHSSLLAEIEDIRCESAKRERELLEMVRRQQSEICELSNLVRASINGQRKSKKKSAKRSKSPCSTLSSASSSSSSSSSSIGDGKTSDSEYVRVPKKMRKLKISAIPNNKQNDDAEVTPELNGSTLLSTPPPTATSPPEQTCDTTANGGNAPLSGLATVSSPAADVKPNPYALPWQSSVFNKSLIEDNSQVTSQTENLSGKIETNKSSEDDNKLSINTVVPDHHDNTASTPTLLGNRESFLASLTRLQELSSSEDTLKAIKAILMFVKKALPAPSTLGKLLVTNPIYKDRIGNVTGAVDVLAELGFQSEEHGQIKSFVLPPELTDEDKLFLTWCIGEMDKIVKKAIV